MNASNITVKALRITAYMGLCYSLIAVALTDMSRGGQNNEIERIIDLVRLGRAISIGLVSVALYAISVTHPKFKKLYEQQSANN